MSPDRPIIFINDDDAGVLGRMMAYAGWGWKIHDSAAAS